MALTGHEATAGREQRIAVYCRHVATTTTSRRHRNASEASFSHGGGTLAPSSDRTSSGTACTGDGVRRY